MFMRCENYSYIKFQDQGKPTCACRSISSKNFVSIYIKILSTVDLFDLNGASYKYLLLHVFDGIYYVHFYEEILEITKLFG